MDIFGMLITACATVLVILIIFGGPFFYAGYVRDLRSKETIKMIEAGILEAPEPKTNGKGSLRWGIVMTGFGLALTIGLYPLGFIVDPSYKFPLNFGPWMTIGLLPLFFGLSLVLVYYVTQDKKEKAADEEETDSEA